MPLVRDFRNYSYKSVRIDRCGRHIGSELYWKLYAIENTVRIVIHSVLTAQVGTDWWSEAVGVESTMAKNASKARARYAAKPQNANPGLSDIHLVTLKELTEILRVNSHLVIRVVPDVSDWIATLESIRVPRNLVGHMNFPNAFDRMAIDSAYSQLATLLGHLSTNRVPVLVPK